MVVTFCAVLPHIYIIVLNMIMLCILLVLIVSTSLPCHITFFTFFKWYILLSVHDGWIAVTSLCACVAASSCMYVYMYIYIININIHWYMEYIEA